MKQILSILALLLFTGTWGFGQLARFVYVPTEYAKVMGQHLVALDKIGCKATPWDLRHGHLVLKSAHGDVASLGQLFEQSAGVLYHCDENLDRWLGEDGKLPLKQRRPRSFFGLWNGQLILATSFLMNPEKYFDYQKAGSIHTDELAGEVPQIFAFRQDYQIVGSDKKPCLVNTYIDVYYATQREASIWLNERGYSLTMSCANN